MLIHIWTSCSSSLSVVLLYVHLQHKNEFMLLCINYTHHNWFSQKCSKCSVIFASGPTQFNPALTSVSEWGFLSFAILCLPTQSYWFVFSWQETKMRVEEHASMNGALCCSGVLGRHPSCGQPSLCLKLGVCCFLCVWRVVTMSRFVSYYHPSPYPLLPDTHAHLCPSWTRPAAKRAALGRSILLRLLGWNGGLTVPPQCPQTDNPRWNLSSQDSSITVGSRWDTNNLQFWKALTIQAVLMWHLFWQEVNMYKCMLSTM